MYGRRSLYFEDNIRLTFECMDSVGHKNKYIGLNRMFYKDAKAFVILYDITKNLVLRKLKIIG